MAVTAEEIAAAPVVLEVGTMREGPFRDLNEVEEANKRSGGHWFDRSTVSFFQSRIAPGLECGRFFVSSEDGRDERGRRYTPRLVRADGSIGDVIAPGEVDDFMVYGTLREARAALAGLEGAAVTVRRLEGRPVVYVGETIVGSRFYDSAGALELAGELCGIKRWAKPCAQLEALWTAYRALGEVDGLEVPRRTLRRRIDRLTARLAAVLEQ